MDWLKRTAQKLLILLFLLVLSGSLARFSGVKFSDASQNVPPKPRQLFVPAQVGYDETISTSIVPQFSGGVVLPADHEAVTWGRFLAPPRASKVIVSVILRTDLTADEITDIFAHSQASYGAIGEIPWKHSDLYPVYVYPVSPDVLTKIMPLELKEVQPGDLVELYFKRYGQKSEDCQADVGVLGWLIEMH